MCKYCDMGHNKLVGYDTGKKILHYSSTYIVKREDGYYLSDNLCSPELKINFCPVCGQKLNQEEKEYRCRVTIDKFIYTTSPEEAEKIMMTHLSSLNYSDRSPINVKENSQCE